MPHPVPKPGDKIRIQGGRKVCTVASTTERNGLIFWTRFCDGKTRTWDPHRLVYNGSLGDDATTGYYGYTFPLCRRCWPKEN